MNRREFVEEKKRLLASSRIVICGCGFVADQFYRALASLGLTGRIAGCAVTDRQAEEDGSEKRFYGVPVRGVGAFAGQADPDLLFCLAVHETAQEAFRKNLAECGVEEGAEDVTEYLCDLLYGVPDGMFRIPVDSLLRFQDPHELWLAVRLAGVRAHLAGSPEERQAEETLYRTMMERHCRADTAERRFHAVGELVRSMKTRGFDPERPIALAADQRILNGAHRLTAARELGIDEVFCVRYGGAASAKEILSPGVRLPADLPDEPDGRRTPDGAGCAQTELLLTLNEELFGGSAAPAWRGVSSAKDGPVGKRAPAVSVIVPVYNVAAYFSSCRESVLAKSFSDLEILLIDDGSDDGSELLCDAWAAEDARVRVFHQKNAGVSAARNRGIGEARGEWIAFLDPDDWIDPDYFAKLLTAAEESGASFAECDVWRYDNRTGKKTRRFCGERFGVPYTLAEHMIFGTTAPYKSISKRSLWIENGIRFPDCAFESPAVYPLVLALAQKTVNLAEPLYYYRIFRENSLIETGYAHRDGSANDTLGTEAMAYLTGEFRRTGLWDRFRETLPHVVSYRLSDILATQFHRRREADYQALSANVRTYLKAQYPQAACSYAFVGGYNLGRILLDLPLLQDPAMRFSFSSVCAIAGRRVAGRTVRQDRFRHPNRYRQLMLEREADGTFWSMLREKKPSALFLDLTAERFDLLEADGAVYTDSDALRGSEGYGAFSAEAVRIPRESERCVELFRSSFRAFLDGVRELCPDIFLCVAETYLAEEVGDLAAGTPHREIEKIRSSNAVLRSCYGWVRETFPHLPVIETADLAPYRTDRDHRYGAVPEHLNDVINEKIAERIWNEWNTSR